MKIPYPRKLKAALALFLAFSLLGAWENFTGQTWLVAQGLVKNSELLGIGSNFGKIPKHRMCGDFGGNSKNTSPPPSKGKSYSEQQLQKALNRQLLEVKKVLDDVKNSHLAFVKAYPQFEDYHEVQIEDLPQGEDNLRRHRNLKVIVAFHYKASGDLDCVVIDAYERKIYEENDYTHKLFRFPYSDIRKLELKSMGYNYKRESLLHSYSLEDQLLVLRTVFYNLLKALYKMDMILASYNYYQTKMNRWQGDI